MIFLNFIKYLRVQVSKRKTFNKNYKFFLILTTCFLLLNTRFASAQTEIPLTLTNARNEVTLDPGESQRVTMKLYNRGESPVAGTIKVVDFVVNDDKGTPVFLEDTNIPISNRFSAASWMSLPYDKMVLPPLDKVTFDITVNVPFNARPGGHYAALIFEASSDFPSQKETTGREGGSAVSPRIAGLFYITVSGPITEKALLSKLLVPKFSEYGPVKVISEITNRGDTHIAPRGFLTVFDWFGRLISQDKLDETNIFPDASRSYENTVGERLMVGRFKLGLSATYGGSGQVLEGYTYFWVIPWKLTLAVALTLAILIILFKNYRRNVVLRQKQLEKKLVEEEKELERLREELRERG